MKIRILAAGCLLIAIALSVFLVQSGNHEDENVKVSGEREPRSHDVEPSNLSSREQLVVIGGVGEIRFKTVDRGLPSIDWLRRLDIDNEEALSLRISKEAWNKPDVYFGEQGEILHITVNKGNFKTVSFDIDAIRKLQEEQGFLIIKSGYPDGLIESGYKPDDFIEATYEFWDRGMGYPGIEIEITPVLVEIVPTGMPIDDLRKQLLHQRIPMILVKESDAAAPSHEPAILTDSKFDSVPVDQRVRRSWALKPYTQIFGAVGAETEIPSGGVLFDEPLKDAWEKVKSESIYR
jgi:hypothetical protein